MKKSISALVVVVIATFSFSCKKDLKDPGNLQQLSNQAKPNEIPDQLKHVAKFLSSSHGVKFSDLEYRTRDSTFIMERDIAIKLADAESDMQAFNKIPKLSADKNTPKGTISQQRYSTLPDLVGYPNIKIFNNCSSQSWRDATIQAIKNWNHPSVKTISRIRITEVFSSSGADCTVRELGYADGNHVAAGRYPFRKFLGSRVVGDFIDIYTIANSRDLAYKEAVITHEIGHILGIMHTGTSEGSYISGTPQYDSYSIMTSASTLGNADVFRGFTQGDLSAIHILHGQTIPSWVQVPGSAKSLAGGDNNFMYSLDLPQQPDLNHYFRKWNGSNWTYMTQTYAGRGVKMATTTAGQYYYITADKKIWQGQVYPNPIQLPGEAIDIAANSSGELFIVSNTYHSANGNKIMKWNGTGWNEYQPAVNAPTMGAKKIALPAGPNAKPFIVTNSGRVYHHFGVDYTWTEIGGSGVNALDIAACNSKNDISRLPIVYIINGASDKGDGNYGIQRWTGNDWYEINGDGTAIGVDDQGHPWIVNSWNDIYRNLDF